MLVKLKFFYIIHPFSTARKVLRASRAKGAFSSLALALAGTLGVGNVFGVCLGIIIGGAGSVFWLFVSAVVSAVLKYSEVVISHDNLLHTGEGAKGGMFYTINAAFSRTGKGMSIIYAASCLLLSLVMGSALQSGTVRETTSEIFNTPPAFVAIFLTFAIAVSILGGVRIISKITAVAIPVTTIIYILLTFCVIIVNRANLAGAISDKVEMVRHTDVIPSFADNAPKLPEIKISVKCDGASFAIIKSPEFAGEVKVPVNYADGKANFAIPAGTFASYALIVIER